MVDVSSGLARFVGTLLFLTILTVHFTPGYSVKRQLNITSYSCPISVCEDNITIIYVTAESEHYNNIVHFLWSIYGSPTVMVAYSSKLPKNRPKSELIIDWKQLLHDQPGAIKFTTKEIDYKSSFVLSSLIQFNDPKDDIFFTKKSVSNIIKHDLQSVKWSDPVLDRKGYNVTFSGTFLGGTLTFNCSAAEDDGRDTAPPRQQYSSNSTRFSISLHGLTTNLTTTDRLAIEIVSIVESSQTENTCAVEDESIDDEYSPAVFRTVVINSTNAQGSSFIAWKPVSYVKLMRDLDTQVPCYQYLLNKDDKTYKQEKISSSKCSSLYTKQSIKLPSVVKGAMGNNLAIYPMELSFGQKKDGWYDNTKFLSWSGQVGFGKPQFDTLSRTLIITIIAGLGVPFLIIIVGSLYVCIKKYREHMTASSYGIIS